MTKTTRQCRACLPAALGACLTLDGCAGLPPAQESMDSEGWALRRALVVTPARGVPLSYRPVTCELEWRRTGFLASREQGSSQLSISAVGGDQDRLLVNVSTMFKGGSMTMLIDRYGTLISSNGTTDDGKLDFNDKNFDQQAAKQMGIFGMLGGHDVNAATALFPHFLGVPRGPGARVADVMMEHSQVYGSYIYRGMVRYKGTQAELFDLVLQGGRVGVVGFLLFDTRHMVPVMGYATLGSLSRSIEATQCSGS